MKSGQRIQNLVRWISRLTCQNRKKIHGILQKLMQQRNLDIRRVCSAGKTKGMQVIFHIRQDRTIGSYQSLYVGSSIIYSIHHMYITMNIADHILTKWRVYSDPEADIFSETNGMPHNTITPIARMRGNLYELDLVLRNNITTADCPLGLFHPHAEYHHIKKENIGLIEVMGLAVLPARLKKEMAELEQAILNHEDLRQNETMAAHADWAEEWLSKYEITDSNIHSIVQKEIGIVFTKVLEDAGVYKRTEEGKAAFKRFVKSL